MLASSSNSQGTTDLAYGYTAANVLTRKSSLVYSDGFIWFEGLSYTHVGHEVAREAADSPVSSRKAFHNFLSCFCVICSAVGRLEILLFLQTLVTWVCLDWHHSSWNIPEYKQHSSLTGISPTKDPTALSKHLAPYKQCKCSQSENPQPRASC